MRSLLFVLTALGVIGLAFWAYRETHRTQQAMAELRGLRAEIASLREAISVQRAEWAYLNRPDRLRMLAELNYDRLRLMPMTPEQFGGIEEVAYPPPLPLLPMLVDPVETFGPGATAGEEPL